MFFSEIEMEFQFLRSAMYGIASIVGPDFRIYLESMIGLNPVPRYVMYTKINSMIYDIVHI
jgi:hypothetical protein